VAKRVKPKTGSKQTASTSGPPRKPSPSASKVKKRAGSADSGVVAKKAGTAKTEPLKPVAGKKRTASTGPAVGKLVGGPQASGGKPEPDPAGRTAPSPESATDATSHDPIQFQEEAPLPKTPLTAKQLREFQELLLNKRAELVGDVERLTDEALNRKADGDSEGSSMPIHMADLGSDNWEQELTLGLIANGRTTVREIDEALERIANKTYGVCLATHQPITLARLRVQPWARYCIDYARLRDEGRAP